MQLADRLFYRWGYNVLVYAVMLLALSPKMANILGMFPDRIVSLVRCILKRFPRKVGLNATERASGMSAIDHIIYIVFTTGHFVKLRSASNHQDQVVQAATAIIDTLVAAGADINKANWVDGGATALHLAVRLSGGTMHPLISHLVHCCAPRRHGASPNMGDCRGDTAVHYAARLPNTGVLEFLLSPEANGDASAHNHQGTTPLFGCSIPALKLLLAAGADIDARDPHGQTALMCNAGDLAKVQALLRAGADPNALTYTGNHILECCYHDSDITQALLLAGADIAVRAPGFTTLHLLATENNLSHLIPHFVAAPSDLAAIHLLSPVGESPLHRAIIRNNSTAVRHLLKAGAKPNQTTADGMTPLMLAVMHKAHDCLRQLIKCGALLASGVMYVANLVKEAMHLRDAVAVAIILQHVPEAARLPEDMIGVSAHALLRQACMQGQHDVLEVLMDKGATSVLTLKPCCSQPLHWAVYGGSLECVELLLMRGADPTARDQNNNTPFDLAFLNKQYHLTQPIMRAVVADKEAPMEIALAAELSLESRWASL